MGQTRHIFVVMLLIVVVKFPTQWTWVGLSTRLQMEDIHNKREFNCGGRGGGVKGGGGEVIVPRHSSLSHLAVPCRLSVVSVPHRERRRELPRDAAGM